MSDSTDSDLATLSRDDLVERARALQTVLRVTQAVSTSRDVADLSQRFVDAVVAYTRFASVCMFRYQPNQQVFDLVAQRGFDMETYPPPSSHLPAATSLTGLAAARREILTTDDIVGDDRVEPATRAALVASGYVSGTSVPIIHREEVLGAFNLIYPLGSALRPDERRLLLALAQTIGLAMAQQIASDRERELETQARRAQQLDSLGVLAGGLAHDFNNLLVGIVGCLDLARVDALGAGLIATAGMLDDALGAADRARALARQLLTFSRGGAPSREPVTDLGRVVRDAASFVARGTSVQCAVEVVEPIGVVEADPGQIAQVVQNLVLNACQASPSGSTVQVRVTRSNGGPPAGEVREVREAHVRIEVTDRGVGIAPDHVPRIFEPFYTVREGGTGLGLSVSHSIVARHGGSLTVDSAPGRGTTFTVDLPAGIAPAVPSAAPGQSRLALEGRALLMDDDLGVRRIASLMLDRLGVEVEEAEHGARALELAARALSEGRPFRVAILDLTVIGGLGAADIVDDLRRVSPGIRVVLSTGYALTDAEAKKHAWDATLDKPYTLQHMRAAIERALST
jgi:signal transduction histidine kinase/ActR/RegA family two-component response regulator